MMVMKRAGIASTTEYVTGRMHLCKCPSVGVLGAWLCRCAASIGNTGATIACFCASVLDGEYGVI
jgi:hypothetical protein